MDTIFALASASGKAGVSIIRLSGPDALPYAAQLGARLKEHDRRLVTLLDGEGDLLDQAFGLSFAKGRSFTGEQVVELHTHGSPAIVRAVLGRLSDLGLRMAEPGEFTRRAMENGTFDLAQVEGLADLIDAETEGQRKQAVRVFAGDLGNLIDGWRAKLLRAAALMEATIDFVDEDVPVDVFPEVKELIAAVRAEVEHERSGVKVRERIREGFEVALIGEPNTGKSTLLNRLAGREAAITSDIAGTTRDVIEVRMELAGLPVTFLDTAGLRIAEDAVEGIGIARGIERAKQADVRVHLLVDDQVQQPLEGDGIDLFMRAKSDLVDVTKGLAVSGKTGEGVSELVEVISDHLSGLTQNAGIAIRTRHEAALNAAALSLTKVEAVLASAEYPVDLIAEDLRTAIRSLDVLVGRIDVENVLGEIFSSFCIGK